LAQVDLDEAISRAERCKGDLDAYALRLLRVELRLLAGEKEAAKDDMRKVLNFIVREGALRAALHAPKNVRSALVVFAQESREFSDFKIIEQLDWTGSGGEASPRAGKVSPPTLDPLSVRELDVLKLLSKGLSNQSIADRLYISLPTV